ncbi:MAG: hypothetical protein KDB47_18155 [Mycobacterium sp.]|nr:hypothetical protein [Mycobacterium sp.]HRV66876.1 hypothetical protein [Candidatus Nanopelagicales bacterium]
MTTMTNASTRSLVAERPNTEGPLLDAPAVVLDAPAVVLDAPAVVLDAPAVEGAGASVPDFHVGVQGKVMIASAGVAMLAAAALYVYGQLAPGV